MCWWLIGSAAVLAQLQAAIQRRNQTALVHGRGLPGLAATLSGYTAMPVALGRQRIEIDVARLFLFDDSGAPCT